jgi:hypothetical protein
MRILTNRGTVLVPMVAALTELVCGKQGFSFASRGEDFDAFARSSDPLIVGIRRIKLEELDPQETDLLGWAPGYHRRPTPRPWARIGPVGATPVAGGGMYWLVCVCIFEHYGPAGRPNERGPLFFKTPPCASYSSSDRPWGS